MLQFVTHLMYIIEWFALFFLTSLWVSPKEAVLPTFIVAGIVDIVFFIKSWQSHFKPKKYDTETKAILLATPSLLYICSAYYKNEGYMMVALVLVASLVIFHFLCLYWQGTEDYIKQNRSFKGMPESAIKNNNGRMITYIIVISFILILCAAFVRFDDAFWWLGKWIVKAVVWIVVTIFEGFSKLIEFILLASGTEARTYDTGVISAYVEESGNEGLAEIVYTVFGFVTLATIFILIGKSIIGLFEREDISQENTALDSKRDYTEIKESLVKPKAVKLSGKTKNGRIRERYKAVVKKNLKGNISVSATVRDITNQIEMVRNGKDMSEIKNLTVLYENERYGSGK